MARIYSTSQKKFIDVPDQQAGQQDTFTTPPQTPSALQNPLTSFFLQKAMAEANSPTEYKSVIDLLTPQAPSATVEKKRLGLQSAYPSVVRMIKTAEQAVPGMRGALSSNLGAIPGVSGGYAEELRKENQSMATLLAKTFAAETGVASDKDVKRWMNMMPRTGDTAEERRKQSIKLLNSIKEEARISGMKAPQNIDVLIKKLNAAGEGGFGTKGKKNKSIFDNVYGYWEVTE